MGIFVEQLNKLQTDYVDVYMLHAVPPNLVVLQSVWMVLEALHDAGYVRALGVANADVTALENIFRFARVPPVYIQNLYKVYKPGERVLHDTDVISFARQRGISIMGWGVLTHWPHVLSPLDDPHVLSVASRVGRTPSQVIQRWSLQHGVGVLSRSSLNTISVRTQPCLILRWVPKKWRYLMVLQPFQSLEAKL